MIGVNDVVVCVNNGPLEVDGVRFKDASPYLKRRNLYRVDGAFPNSHGHMLITLKGVRPSPPNDGGWIVDRFRKVTAADEGFKLLLKLHKPVKDKRPVKEDA